MRYIALLSLLLIEIYSLEARVVYQSTGRITSTYTISELPFSTYNQTVTLSTGVSLSILTTFHTGICLKIPAPSSGYYYYTDVQDQFQLSGHSGMKLTTSNSLISKASFQNPDYYSLSIGSRFYDGVNGTCTNTGPAPGYANFPSTSCFGNFCSLSYQYIGLKFVVNGLTYYGWAQVSDFGKNIVEVAYETVPGFPIVVGDKVGYFSTSAGYNTIKGCIYVDNNSNCIKDAGEVGVPNIPVIAKNTVYASFSDSLGNYELLVPSGTSTYSIDVVTNPYQGYTILKTCPSGASTISVSTNGANQVLGLYNMAVSTCALLKVDVSQDMLRRCRKGKTNVRYENAGTLDASNSTIKVILPSQLKALSSVPAWTSVSGDTLIYTIATIKKASSGIISIVDSVMCGDESIRGRYVCTKAFIGPSGYCSPSASWDGADLTILGTCLQNVLAVKISNKGSDMADSSVYRIFADNVVVKKGKCKLSAGASCSFSVSALGSAIRVEVDQTFNHPQLLYRAMALEGCGIVGQDSISRGISNQLPNPVSFNESSYCAMIRDSYDPNEKEAFPSGTGASHVIASNEDITYTVRFQNTGNAPAYTVVVVDTLSTNLDLSTLRMVGTSHACKMEVYSQSPARLVWIMGGINLPDSTSNEPASHGYITFKVSQKKNLANGTLLKNRAHIFFDYNSAIATNQVAHTIGSPVVEQLLMASNATPVKSLCVGTSASLQVNASGFGTIQYQWIKDGVDLTQKTHAQETLAFELNDAGSYRCRVFNGFDTIYSTTTQVLVNRFPGLRIQNPDSVCEGKSIDITSSFLDTNATNGVIHYWKEASAITPLANEHAITIEGTYYIQSDNSGCKDIRPVLVAFKKAPVLIITNPNPACTGEIVDIRGTFYDAHLLAGSVSFWQDTACTQVLVAPESINLPGTYFVRSEYQTCSDIRPIQVSFRTRPSLQITNPAPVCEGTWVDITSTFTDLNNTGGSVDYWLDAAAQQAIPNPTQIATAGTYYVKSTNQSCSDIKPVVVQTELCTATNSNNPENQIRIYPNPTVDYIVIESQTTFEYELFNEQGIVVFQGQESLVDVSSLPVGTYHMKLLNALGVVYKEIMKQ